MKPRRRIVIVAFDRVQALDVVGPLEVFSAAHRVADCGYRVEVATPAGGDITSESGLTLRAHRSMRGRQPAIDTLVVAGGVGVPAAERDDPALGWIGRAAPRARRVCSVCTGAFLLARAGAFDDRRATTHWASCDELARRYPSVAVERDRIFVRDGNVWTSAGVTAGMDLALALVEEDVGRSAALTVARWLVLFAKRPGGQAQFSSTLAAQVADRSAIRDLQDWIGEHPHKNLSVERLADQTGMSTRSFARAFRREVGMTPAAYVEAVRVERAKLLLESTATHVDEIAARCGFGTPETLRRAFARRVGASPSDYRARFGSPRLEAA